MAPSRQGAFPAKTLRGATDHSRIRSVGIGREGADPPMASRLGPPTSRPKPGTVLNAAPSAPSRIGDSPPSSPVSLSASPPRPECSSNQIETNCGWNP